MGRTKQTSTQEMDTSMKKLYDLLERVTRERWKYGYQPEEDEVEIWNPLTADEWQEFKRKFIAEYGGEKVQDDGLTHTEFLQYIKDGYREMSEHDPEPDILTLIRKRQKSSK